MVHYSENTYLSNEPDSVIFSIKVFSLNFPHDLLPFFVPKKFFGVRISGYKARAMVFVRIFTLK